MPHLNEHQWNDETKQFLLLVKKEHEGQMRAGGQHQWEHCLSVAQELENALDSETDLPQKKRREFVLGALGHDLYEDTTIRPEQVIAQYGMDVHERIRGLTNEKGDTDVGSYVEHMHSAPEEDRLIKLADLWHNYSSVAKNRKELGKEWIEGWFLPIVEPMYAQVTSTQFNRYPRAAEILTRRAGDARKMLLDTIKQPYSEPDPSPAMPLSAPSDPASSETHEREEWDFNKFTQYYNEIGKRQGGWSFEDKNGAAETLRSYYMSGGTKTLRQFAEARFGVDQRT
ncbi:MAG: hypothetical protein V1926_00255 [Candidatus Peregrinibacteria bacterium]